MEAKRPVSFQASSNCYFSESTKTLLETEGYEPEPISIEWECNRGYFTNESGETAIWHPGKESGMATILATASLRVVKPAGPFAWVGIAKEKSFVYFRIALMKVMVPCSYKEAISDPQAQLEIGRYPSPQAATAERYPSMYPQRYAVPKAFYNVTSKSAGTSVSPHFKLGDFDMHFPYLGFSFPHYIAIRRELIQKLEMLVEAMHEDGVRFPTFTIISGFRPPSYNLGSIDKGADLKMPFSRHQYGDAVDLIIDCSPMDGVMDDLNDDGKIDILDSQVILKYVNRMDAQFLRENSPLLGGAGVYSYHDIPERVQSPYLHIDTRGYPNSNGQPVRWKVQEKQE